MVAYLTGGTSLGVFPGTASFPVEDREADNTTETGNNKYFLSPDIKSQDYLYVLHFFESFG